MSRKFATSCIVICIVALAFSGCAATRPIGILYTEVQLPVQTITSEDVSYTKVGEAKAYSVFNLVCYGDASLRAAIRAGKISKVKYVDYSAKSMFGILSEYTTTVYGD